ncbi:MAG: imidazole glycerol phosphate synthase subunit HisH [Clostridium sp.]|nr:imidazole glycerol phosphate synthase subunit HisH [Acetatifactor muris]MCM1528140.1 imidazole glycerol phosphate synthase subunit HisH [Bacteroides sp.]MCM1564253.1 imidazole glycerol phosphate synthase subunit HisH [Clostridium sp.]
MIAIIDYDAGNIKSVEKALQYLGEDTVVTRDEEAILAADGVILPGVGAFGDAMGKLWDYGLVPVIHKCVERGIPFLGICLGLQLMFDGSEESPGVEGLHLLKGMIRRIPGDNGLKVPHIGWNNLHFPRRSRLMDGLLEDTYVYFVHSYYLQAEREEIVAASAEYGVTIHAAVEQGNLFACQFHPEKSSEAGLQILRNFIRITKEGQA